MTIEKHYVKKESTGMHYDPNTDKEYPIFCPSYDLDCPYNDNGICYIADPVEDCDDFASYFETWEDWENS